MNMELGILKVSEATPNQATPGLNFPVREECVYTSCYCEENVWKLCEHVKSNFSEDLDNCFAIFISNSSESVPLWCQKAGDSDNGFVIWDYHVIFIHKKEHCYVYDLDTTLTFPCAFQLYVDRTFRDEAMMFSLYHRMLRVIPAAVFLENFSSDRSHMVDKWGVWTKAPPNYPCIQTASVANNLEDFISMDPARGVGEILTLKQFINRFQTSSYSH